MHNYVINANEHTFVNSCKAFFIQHAYVVENGITAHPQSDNDELK